eukprot:gene4388-4809_t
MTTRKQTRFDWPKEATLGKALNDFQEDLLCPLCHSFYSNPHTTHCGHSFCEDCIHRHGGDANTVRCPDCQETVTVTEICKNVSLARLVEKFRSLGPALLQVVPREGTAKKRVRLVTPGKENVDGGCGSEEAEVVDVPRRHRFCRPPLPEKTQPAVLLATPPPTQIPSSSSSSSAAIAAEEAPPVENLLERLSELPVEALGPWQVAYSARLGRPFFFHREALTGQFALPRDLRLALTPPSREEEEAEGGERDSEGDHIFTQLSASQGELHISPDSYDAKEDKKGQTLEIDSQSEPQLLLNPTASISSAASSTSIEPPRGSEHQELPTNEQIIVDDATETSSVEVIESTALDCTGPDRKEWTQDQEIDCLASQLKGQQWICRACTFINDDRRRAACDLCETANPDYLPPSKPSRRSSQRVTTYNEAALFRASFTPSSPSSQPVNKKSRRS